MSAARARRRASHGDSDDPNRWLISYADFITLLFAFFVVLYAISNVDAGKWAEVSSGMKTAFVQPMATDGPTGVPTGRRDGRATGAPGRGTAAWDLMLLKRQLEAAMTGGLGEGDTSAPVRLQTDDRGILLTLADEQFFKSGSAELVPSAQPLLDEIGSVLVTSSTELRIEGHTDDRPVSSADGLSNWDISSRRASAVARYLIDNHRIQPRRIGIAGYASHRPVAANDTPENRALNRRVDIVVLKPGDEASNATPEAQEDALRGLVEQLTPLDGAP